MLQLNKTLTFFAALGFLTYNAQVIIREDSLNAELVGKSVPTVISGFGEGKVEYDMRNQTGKANLTRNILFLGHRFSDKISFLSEMEIEDAKIVGGKASGEISDANRINLAYANNTPTSMYGYYVELGYNIFKPFKKLKNKSMIFFIRYENMDLNANVPKNGIENVLQKKQYIVAGLHFQPLNGVSVKLDYVYRVRGECNKALYVTNPYTTNTPFYTNYGD